MLDNIDDLKLYKRFLNTIQTVIDKYFDEQKEYISCKKGCAYCCEYGAYPYTKLEYDYLIMGFFRLEKEVQQEIILRIKELKEEYANTENKKNFMYRCPFLGENKICTLYEYRGIICRTFGLLQDGGKNKTNMPFCQKYGLNYSKIYDEETGKFKNDLIKKHGYKTPPKKYRIGIKDLLDKNLFKDEMPNFGEIKPLIEWF